MRGMPRTLGRSIHAARAGFGRGMALERYARVVLIGFSGTGKSTVGKHLAERLGWALVDTDAEIERRAGTTIPALFASTSLIHTHGPPRDSVSISRLSV